MHETYAPVIRMRRDLASGEPSKIRNARRHLGSNAQLGRWKCLWINLSRPVILLTRSFICFILSLYMALVYGIYYLMFATFSGMFEPTPFCVLFSCWLQQTSSLIFTGLGLRPPVLPISVSASGLSSLPSSADISQDGFTITVERKTMV